MAASLGLVFTGCIAVPVSSPEVRLGPSDIDAMPSHDPGVGTSGVAGVRTTMVIGDPAKAGPYTLRLSVPPNTKIQAHSHRDDRTAIVISGVWFFGFGTTTDRLAEKELPAGSVYTEPGGVAHFAETKTDPAVVYIVGTGPSDTVFVKK
jgi:quercetin dioxygenase-like cupin family protein